MSTSREDFIARIMATIYCRLALLCRKKVLRLTGRLEHIREPGMRGRAFLRLLSAEPPPVAVELLQALEQLARERRPPAQKVYLDLLDEELVREFFTPEKIEEIWKVGRLRGYNRMLEVFFYTSGADTRLEDKQVLPPEIRDTPLGRRKAMARSLEIGVLEKLIRDNDVSVIRNLLANPRITEREVVSIAARRPNSAAILEAVASHRRWIARYIVKKALVCNPWTPTNISVPLLKYLFKSDLLEICRMSSINEFIKRAARDLLRR